MLNWKEQYQPARLGEDLDQGVVRCHLSPRNCVIKEGKQGFCGVRGNRDGRLVTFNYGKGVHITEETIETEACNHYSPGERILSLGNVGCMLNCSYCHNWKTSQARYVSDKDIYLYTPEEVVETAIRHGIRVLSWTYNDPVVWHEFVRDTAKLGQEAGLINLYKSAFFITEQAVDELLPYIDIFSISIKSIDDDYYRKLTTGWVQPVLDATKQVYKAGKHVEVSTLMITGISDDEATARKVAEWVLRDLGPEVPMHFVRFHPDYKMTETSRTPIPNLYRARQIAKEMGVEHVYLGNVFEAAGTDTFCSNCGDTLVTRFGLNAQILGLNEKGHCLRCGRDNHFKLMGPTPKVPEVDDFRSDGMTIRSFDWHGDIASLHVQAKNAADEPRSLYHRRRKAGGERQPWKKITLVPGESWRFIISKGTTDEAGPEVALPNDMISNLHEVFDRAHFPTVALEDESSVNDVSPLPYFQGNQHRPKLSGGVTSSGE
jgi:pyruvate formate lyase activating enzyme